MAQVKRFLQEVRGELKKVSWPGRRELMESTLAVIVTTLLLGIFIGIVDFFLSQLIGVLMR
ncbi:MAG: preprotein translocase subunit SecE [Candidatus Omnitrophota bacterium]|nr:MAG: preprotein translocase subunit SecE [Candidatus Omnitrophota bacterium]